MCRLKRSMHVLAPNAAMVIYRILFGDMHPKKQVNKTKPVNCQLVYQE